MANQKFAEEADALGNRMSSGPHEIDRAGLLVPLGEQMNQPAGPDVVGDIPDIPQRDSQPLDTPMSQCTAIVRNQVAADRNIDDLFRHPRLQ